MENIISEGQQIIPLWAQLLFGFFSGIISGIIATLYMYFLRTKRAPEFEISDAIVEYNGKYSFKIQNLSKRTLSNINIRITYYTLQMGNPTFIIEKAPVLRGKNEDGVKESYYGMYESVIEIEAVRKRKRATYMGAVNRKDELDKNEKPQIVPINEFFRENNDGFLEIAITFDDQHKVFGNVQRFKTKQYKNENCIRFNSRFKDGELETTKIVDEEYTNS